MSDTAPALKSTPVPKLDIEIDKGALQIKETVLAVAAHIQAIENPEQAEEVGELLKGIKGLAELVEESRKKIKKPFDDACKSIQKVAKDFMAEIEQEDYRLRQLLGDYVAAQQRKQLEEVRTQGEVISSTTTGAGIVATDVHKYEVTDLKKAYEASPGLFDIVP